ncbi:WD repeat-containing protein on Y chromosome [Labrus bergylta]|uniref:WD repeat-containing protein on Y chromosome n=1 Tax=Labrus bergylta TaxID=56723 RepID=UPI0033140750
MTSHKDVEEEISPMNAANDAAESEEFSSTDFISELLRIFKEADVDKGGGLDMEEFCVAMKKISKMTCENDNFKSLTEEDFQILHMKIDTNCDSTVDLGELLTFMLCQADATSNLDLLFPKPFKVTPMNHQKNIVKLIFNPLNDAEPTDTVSGGSQARVYLKGQYLSMTSNGILNFWTDRFESPQTFYLDNEENTLPYMQKRTMCVNDMVYLPELKQIAVSTNKRELAFYSCHRLPEAFEISNSLILEDQKLTSLNYWSDGTKAVFSVGDSKGYLYIFISNNVHQEGLFCQGSYEKMSLKKYPTVYISNLLTKQSKNFQCHRRHVFEDACSQIQFIPTLNSFAVCGASSRDMVLITLSEPHSVGVSTFRSKPGKEMFTCVEYCAERLVTGGMDGLLRVWIPNNTENPENIMVGHTKPVTHIMYNQKDDMLLSLSDDKNVHVWCTIKWMSEQSFQVQGMGTAPIASTCWNTINNELVVATSNVATTLGRGTDVFQKSVNSHIQPVCCTLYNNIFKQVVSVCQNGVVMLWNIITGKAELQFKVTPDQQVGLVAISFDEPQRRLITISQDGKVRLWNFNSGKELIVLSGTMPNKVTGIVCINDRIFVSGLNSRTIFNMDLEDKDHRYMRHKYLKDISSMDVHENTLITASSNAYIVVWKLWSVEAAEAAFWINTHQSPHTYMVDKRHPGQTGCLTVDMCKRKIAGKKQRSATSGKAPEYNRSLICLKTRENRVDIATLLTYAGDYIYAWSPKVKGGLLGKFKAVEDESAVLTTMSTDVDEQILLTGDSLGNVSLWDIDGFWSGKDSLKEPFEITNEWKVSLCPPPLLGSWKAHLTEVVSVMFDSKREHIVTAGLDCNVRLWTNSGCFIGLFRRHQWDLMSSSPQQNFDHELQEIQSMEKEKDQILKETKENCEEKSNFRMIEELEKIEERLEERHRSDKELEHKLKTKFQDLDKCDTLSETIEKARPPISDSQVYALYWRAMQVVPQIDIIDKNMRKRMKEPQQRATVKVKEGTENSPETSENEDNVSSPDVRDRVPPHDPRTPLSGFARKVRVKSPDVDHIVGRGNHLKNNVLTPCPPDTKPDCTIYVRKAKYGRVNKIQNNKKHDSASTPCPSARKAAV